MISRVQFMARGPPWSWGQCNVLSSEFYSLNVKLPEYEAHPSPLSIKEKVSTLIQMYNEQHMKYCFKSL
jgi:hypothetical protein